MPTRLNQYNEQFHQSLSIPSNTQQALKEEKNTGNNQDEVAFLPQDEVIHPPAYYVRQPAGIGEKKGMTRFSVRVKL